MKTKIAAGAELDLLTQDELHAEIEQMLSGYLRPSQRLRLEQSVKLDSNGAGTLILYTVEAGYLFLLNRLHVEVTTASTVYTYGAPYTSATGYLKVKGGDGQTWDGTSFDPTAEGISIPGDITASDSYALFYYGYETVEVDIVGGPASGFVLVRGQGLLEPLPAKR